MSGRIYYQKIEGIKEIFLKGIRPKKIELIPYKIIGTKTDPFITFGVTAILKDDYIYIGHGTAPMATSGGKKEPKAIENFDKAAQHVYRLSYELLANLSDNNFYLNPFSQDKAILDLDAKLAKEKNLKDYRPTSGIGSEVAIASSVALLEATAAFAKIPLPIAINAILNTKYKERSISVPVPKFNYINCGRHGAKRPDGKPYVWIQETLGAPIGAKNFEEAMEIGIEVLSKVISLAGSDKIGHEAGISPELKSPEDAFCLLSDAIIKSGYEGKMKILVDAAASEFSEAKKGSDKFLYELYPGEKKIDSEKMVKFWEKMVKTYKIISIEDGMNSEDKIGWKFLMEALGNKIEIQGDDLFVTDADELEKLHDYANSILIKPNQAGTILRTIETVAKARKYNYTISPSHRSGKVPGGYGIIPELAIGVSAEWLKAGAPRRERLGFYNNVSSLILELKNLGIEVDYAGEKIKNRFNLV